MDHHLPTPTHFFITLLDTLGLLHLNLTQNIDNLEEKAGLRVNEKLVQAHGSSKGAHCAICDKDMDEKVLKQKVKEGVVYRCSSCDGPVKPKIVLFGEALPRDFI